MKKTYKIHPDNIIVWPGSVSHFLIWMLICKVYEIPLWWQAVGYWTIGIQLIIFVVKLWGVDMIDILKPLNRDKDENNR